MKTSHLKLSALCASLFAGHAWAALEPFSLGASETVQHQSNIGHSDTAVVSDWLSTTELSAAVNQPLGRDKLAALVEVDFNRYKRQHSLDATGYLASAEFDWSTVGDLSGSLGIDSHRRQYIAGETSEIAQGETEASVYQHNLQTDNHAFAHIALGGQSRWTIFGGVDANQRRYSLDAFKNNDEHQWSGNAGTRYSTSPDLSFGLTGNYVSGEYPRGVLTQVGETQTTSSSKFDTRSVDLTTKWQASGNSALDASVGYTDENNDQLTGPRKFVNGSLSWTWTPPSHFTINLGLKRSSDADASLGGVNVASASNSSSLNGTSINNAAHLEIVYSLTAKVNFDASGDYTQRKYSGLKFGDSSVAGTTATSRYFLTLHYLPTRTTDVSCGGGTEKRSGHVLSGTINLTPAYTDNYVQCAASIRFD